MLPLEAYSVRSTGDNILKTTLYSQARTMLSAIRRPIHHQAFQETLRQHDWETARVKMAY